MFQILLNKSIARSIFRVPTFINSLLRCIVLIVILRNIEELLEALKQFYFLLLKSFKFLLLTRIVHIEFGGYNWSIKYVFVGSRPRNMMILLNMPHTGCLKFFFVLTNANSKICNFTFFAEMITELDSNLELLTLVIFNFF